MKRKKSIFILLAILFVPILILAQKKDKSTEKQPKGTLSFFITSSSNGYGIESTIILKSKKEVFEIRTNKSGRHEFMHTSDKYEVEIYAEGYSTLKTHFFIKANETIQVKGLLDDKHRKAAQYKERVSPILNGYVVDEETGRPLSNVKVELKEESLNTFTNAEGFYELYPQKFSKVSSLDDSIIRSELIFSKKGYTSYSIKDLLIVPDLIKTNIHLKTGSISKQTKYHQNILDQTKKDIQNYEESQPEPTENASNSNTTSSSCNIPTTIRVGTSCSCTSCSSVNVMSLQYYSESGLDDEWISSWSLASLQAGSIPYRTYGGYYVNNPVKPNFDIASSTCNQVWGISVYNNTQSAAQSTSDMILTSNGSTPNRSEYSAENNYGGTSYNCSNGYAGGSGAYTCHNDNICSGKSPAGHGRGMCQWGSQRWALNGKSFMWIINHYYVNTVGYSLCEQANPPTNLSVNQSPDCNNNASFTWDNPADNWTIQISTNSSFSNYSSKTLSSGTSTSAPSGFSPTINWQPYTTYYWRIVHSNGTENGASFIYTQCDQTAPTTSIDISPGWKNDDFVVNFNDQDEANGSGIAKRFYHVLYYNGVSWKANPNNGFYADNFDGTTLDSSWTIQTGTWSISSTNKLKQSDESIYNSNVYAPLAQDLSNRYLYTWNGKISGNEENRRAGLHFFCDNPTQNERGNSYLVYFRAGGNSDPNNNNKVQIYKATGNNLSLKKSVSHTINPDQWYTYKVIFDRVTGELYVYVDGQVVAAWTDSSPHFSGSYISFRNGNSKYEVDNFKAYRTRYPQVDITVGLGSLTDVPFQNPNPSTPSAKIKSVVMDNAQNLSDIEYKFVDIDWTKPEDFIVNDGANNDIDVFSSHSIASNWSDSEDPNSGITNYQVAIGTNPGDDDVLTWTNKQLNTNHIENIASLSYNQVYYVSVLAENAAGLTKIISSDGQKYIDSSTISTLKEDLMNVEVFPNPASKKIRLKNLKTDVELSIYDMLGKLILENKITPKNPVIDISHVAKSSYKLVLKTKNQFIIKKIIVK